MMASVEGTRRSGRSFRSLYIWFALLIPAAALAFAKSYFNRETFSGKAFTLLIHIHAALMMLWLLMLIAQAWFIRTKRLQLHRWVGRSSYVIAPTIILAVLLVEHQSLNRAPDGITAEDAQIEVYGVPQILAFAATWGLAILYRKRTPLHVRFMISTAFAIGTAMLFRILMNWFQWAPGLDSLDGVAAANWAVMSLVLLALIAMDWRMGVKRSPFWVVTVLISVMNLGYWTYGKTDGWFAFCKWFADLPLLATG